MARRGWWGWCGAGYAGLVLTGLLSGGESPSTDAEFVAFYADPGNRAADFLFYGEVLVAAVLLLVFTAGLRERLGGFPGSLAHAAGTASATMLAVSAAVAVSVSAAAGQAGFTVDPDTATLLGNVFWMSFTGSVAVLGPLIATVSLDPRALPRWLGWAGVPVAVLSLASYTFFPLLLAAVWLAVAGIVLALRAAPAERELATA